MLHLMSYTFGGTEYVDDVVLLLDAEQKVFDGYKKDQFHPKYVVIDRDMTIVYKSSLPDGKQPAELEMLRLLQ